MNPGEAAQILADAMNEIEAAGFLLYPHPRPVGISIRTARSLPADHPEKTIAVASVWDDGDGQGWKVRMPK